MNRLHLMTIMKTGYNLGGPGVDKVPARHLLLYGCDIGESVALPYWLCPINDYDHVVRFEIEELFKRKVMK